MNLCVYDLFYRIINNFINRFRNSERMNVLKKTNNEKSYKECKASQCGLIKVKLRIYTFVVISSANLHK